MVNVGGNHHKLCMIHSSSIDKVLFYNPNLPHDQPKIIFAFVILDSGPFFIKWEF